MTKRKTGPPWSVGDFVEFASFDSENADTRELDGTTARVVDVDKERDMVRVQSLYGFRWHDPFEFVASTRKDVQW